MLPPPSEEQRTVLDRFGAGDDVVVTAVAGAGKTTLLLHACALFPDEEVLIVAYNSALASEMNALLKQHGLSRAAAYTFHGLASATFGRLCADDNAMFALAEETLAHGSVPRRAFEPRHLLLDEAQDMRDLYYEVLRLCVDVRGTHAMVVGDLEQELYSFEVDDPAKPDYLLRPEAFFRRSAWVRARLSVSFRLTPPLAQLTNSIKAGAPLVAGNLGPAPPPVVLTLGLYEWAKLLPRLKQMAARHRPERIAVLVRSVRTAHPSVRKFVNAVVSAGLRVYIHGVDAPLERVRAGKITVATYYAAKGLTFDACITIGAAEDQSTNAMYVATSRSRQEQVLVLDRVRPPRRLLRAIRQGAVECERCAHTQRLVRAGYVDPEELARTEPAVRELTGHEVRGRAPLVHASLGITTVLAPTGEPLPAECVVEAGGAAGGAAHEVAQLYVLAALLSEEHALAGCCRRLEQLLHGPSRASYDERLKRARADEDDDERHYDPRATVDELLPAAARALVERAQASPREAVRWCAAAVGVSSFGTYHHRSAHLLDAAMGWVDDAVFAGVLGHLRAQCTRAGPPPRFDALLRRVGKVTTTQYRAQAVVGEAAWLIEYATEITPSMRLHACTPAAVDDAVRRCCVLNARTGEVQSFCVDPGPLRERLGVRD